jgi:N-acetylneuraminic acid mutarotase
MIRPKKMKTLSYVFGFLYCLQCSGDNWSPRTPVGGKNRNDAVGFEINVIGKGYVGMGGDGVGGFLNDFWEYNPLSDIWTRKADYPGQGRAGLIYFSIGSKGYVGGGATDVSFANDFWEYDPVANTWTKKANLPSGARFLSFSFSIGTKGYFGAGWNSSMAYTSDFWEFDPTTNSWTQKANYGSGANSRCVGIGTSSKGYACMGYPSVNSDFWEYDPITNVWTKKANVGGLMYADVVGFSICEKVYIATGESYDSLGLTDELWEFEPFTNIWTKKANFPGGICDEATGFSLLGKGYLGTGGMGLNDWFEYSPDQCIPTGISEFDYSQKSLWPRPNPFQEKLYFKTPSEGTYRLQLYNNFANLILVEEFEGDIEIDAEQIERGIYFYEITDEYGITTHGKLVKQ